MGRRVPIQVGKSPAGDGVPLQSVERVVNGYVKMVPEGKQQTPIYGTPGAVVWSSGLDGGCRGRRVIKGVPWAVMGHRLYSFASDGTATERGAIPGTARVAMAGDGTNVVVVAGGEIYVWDGSTLNTVTDPDAPSASSVDWVDGYFAFGETDTDTWFISELDDPESYDALDFSTAEWKPDVLVTPFVLRRTLYMLGRGSIEAQQNVGTPDFPFARYQDVFIETGVAGREAACAHSDTLYLLADDGTPRRLDGLTATPIGDDAVQAIITGDARQAGWSDLSATVCSAHIWEKRLWIYYWNPDGCVVFDQSTQRWHVRKSHGQATTRYSDVVEAFNKVLAFDATEGKVYELAADSFDEAGEVLPFEITTPFVFNGGTGFSIDDTEVIAQMGVGSLTLDPRIALEMTADGEVFRTRQYQRMGKIGDRDGEIRFGAQGSFKQAAMRLTITDPVQRAVLGLFAEIDPDND